MALRRILLYPDPALKQISEAVTEFDEQLESLLADLEDTLEDSPGCVGIAAPQIGFLKRVVLVDVSRNRKPVPNHGRKFLINPVLEMSEGAEMGREGCLSLPHLTANVIRASRVKVSFTTRSGQKEIIESSAFEARVILHEMDHLDGLLFLDKVGSLKTDVFRRKRY